MDSMKISIAHSPDSDDAFMFYAMTQGRLDTSGLQIEHVLQDIETLNQEAFEGVHEISAISLHAYAYLHDRYALMPSGASFGDGYGPVVVSKQPLERSHLPQRGHTLIEGELHNWRHLALAFTSYDYGHLGIPQTGPGGSRRGRRTVRPCPSGGPPGWLR